MSFSFTVSVNEIRTTLSSVVDDKIASLPDSSSKDEAIRFADVISEIITSAVSDESTKFSTALVNGFVSSNNAQLSVHVIFQPVKTEASDSKE